jgi:8-oxo-dGTP pyrophosphatase MutT (NUDIX family)
MRPKGFSAGVVLVRLVGNERGYYVLLRAYTYWAFPKGLYRAKARRARRELEAETGIKDIDFA